jgi:lipopolysaccharide cholinephosphotransferase
MRLLLLLVSKYNLSILIQKKAKSIPYENSTLVGVMVGGYIFREIHHKQIFEDHILMPFEDGEFRVMTGYGEYLKNIYGNYLELPPLEKRESPHNLIGYWIN